AVLRNAGDVGAAQDPVVPRHAGHAVAALAREGADLAGRDAAARRAVEAVRALLRAAAEAARHAQHVQLAAVDLRRDAVAAVVLAVGAEAADVAFGVAAGVVRALADRRVGAEEDGALDVALAERRPGARALAAAAVLGLLADVADQAAAAGLLEDVAAVRD